MGVASCNSNVRATINTVIYYRKRAVLAQRPHFSAADFKMD